MRRRIYSLITSAPRGHDRRSKDDRSSVRRHSGTNRQHPAKRVSHGLKSRLSKSSKSAANLKHNENIAHKPKIQYNAAAIAALVKQILQDGMAESGDTCGRGYSDSRDSLFANKMRSQVPAGLQRADRGGDGGGRDNGDGNRGAGSDDVGDDGDEDGAGEQSLEIEPELQLLTTTNIWYG